MKRKYYLRGLGFGILITSIVFIITGRSEMTDEEVIRRAEQLGYVKAEVEVTPSINLDELREKDVTPSPVATVGISVTPEPTKGPVLTPEPTPTVTFIPTPTPEPTATPVPTEVPEITSEPTPTNVPQDEPKVVTAQITVEPGNSANMVCDKIEDAGIISDGDGLRNYIVENNLADYINVGTYTLSSDMTYEEIAKSLTGR